MASNALKFPEFLEPSRTNEFLNLNFPEVKRKC